MNGLSSHPRQGIILTVIGVLLIALTIGIYLFGFPGFTSNTANLSQLAVAVGPFQASPLYALDATESSLTPLTVNVEGKEQLVVDQVQTSGGAHYYLLIDPLQTITSNLYMRSADGSVKKMTDSASAKFNLTYSAASGLLGYQEAIVTKAEELGTTKEWSVVVFDTATGATRTIGKGVKPSFVSANILALTNSEGLVAANVTTGSTTTILAVDDLSLYAIHPDGTHLARYNKTTRQVDLFALTYGGAAPSFISSIEISYVPATLGFVGGDLYAATASFVDDTHTKYTFSRLQKDHFVNTDITSPVIGIPQRLYTYE